MHISNPVLCVYNNVIEHLHQSIKLQSQINEEEFKPLLLSPINLQQPYIW